MNPIYRTKLATAGLLSVLLSASLLTAGCGTTAKNNIQTTVSKPIVKQLSEPSLVYLSSGNQLSSEAWMTIAKNNYATKRYARALRAANEALSVDNERLDARQLAMLSAVKVMESNIDAYHDNTLMDSGDKATLNETLTNITTLVNASN
ncbi:hypothetical protein ACT3N8_13265 [Psychrobacter aquimaris]|uniref:hypothetical protein n=1 Tax=Psychrobacter aquimaris TaxID=292733 RepID=UPI003FD2739F